MNEQMLEKVRSGQGFVAALDQSGGSTPKALRVYGIEDDAWSSEDEMFDLVHEMRTRIITSPAFSGEKLVGAILFEKTMDRTIEGTPTAEYLWSKKNVVPFVKVDKGLAEVSDGVQMMKPMPELEALLARARGFGVFGTKMRSMIRAASASGITAIVDQQFEVGETILQAGLVPILEPEVDITIDDKAQAEALLRDRILAGLETVSQPVLLKLSLPTEANFYRPLIEHANVVRVVALSGGYARVDANARLAQNEGMIASFSRALSEGLSADQTDEAFHATLAASIDAIYQASLT